MTTRALLPIVLAAVLAAGCSSVDFWKDQLSEPTPQASRSPLALGQTFEEDVQLARTFTERYWQRKFEAAGRIYRPLQEFVAYSGEDGPSCGGQPAVAENAFYCPVGHFVAYDETWMRSLYDKLGDGAVYVIIPHEVGHAIQAQLMRDFSLSIQRELQADCYAGGALRGMIDSNMLEAETGDDAELLTNLAAAGDPSEAWWREDAHGTPIQRQRSFATGFNNGVDAC
ncbi:neutral zinc metallopeptidase [Sphaerisporangium sp. NPDC049002]|uniref:neutral zinc metallopeptidase n=1 Tax=unclassified Sphaerisporangium TaxID=2630420 RepID=UPI0033F7D343